MKIKEILTEKVEYGLYVDDERPLPDRYKNKNDKWDVAKNYDEAIKLLSKNKYDIVSLDHDIASWNKDGREMTGYDIALFLAQRKHDGDYVPPEIFAHTANPVGKKNIDSVISRYLS